MTLTSRLTTTLALLALAAPACSALAAEPVTGPALAYGIAGAPAATDWTDILPVPNWRCCNPLSPGCAPCP